MVVRTLGSTSGRAATVFAAVAVTPLWRGAPLNAPFDAAALGRRQSVAGLRSRAGPLVATWVQLAEVRLTQLRLGGVDKARKLSWGGIGKAVTNLPDRNFSRIPVVKQATGKHCSTERQYNISGRIAYIDAGLGDHGQKVAAAICAGRRGEVHRCRRERRCHADKGGCCGRSDRST
jgi:hypothetical protein